MRLSKYMITEDEYRKVFEIDEHIIEKVKIECKQFFDTVDKEFFPHPLRRIISINLEDNQGVKMQSRLLDRRPHDTKIEVHNKYNELFEKKFGWKVRNGVFAERTSQLFHPLFFPCGDFKYCWNPRVTDLYIKDKHDPMEISKRIDGFIDTDLNKANQGYEISFKCDEYYILRFMERKQIEDLFN